MSIFYYPLKRSRRGAFVASRLLELRRLLRDEGVPEKRSDRLIIATWNIREFDSASGGRRLEEAIFFIAEILSHFDLVAIQEVNEDLEALKRVMRLLGPNWQYVSTHMTAGALGHQERMVFLFDRRKAYFGDIAGQVVIPARRSKEPESGSTTFIPSEQLARPPFLCAFQVGWLRFMLCTVHILYGKSIKDDPRRVREIELAVEYLIGLVRRPSTWSEDLILLGDFNVFDRDSQAFRAIQKAGFVVPEELQKLPATNTGLRGRYYDQIAFSPKAQRIEPTGRAGVINFFKTVFTDLDEEFYEDEMGRAYRYTKEGKKRSRASRRRYYRTFWRSHQMSDHLPLWLELKIDFSDDYLQRLAQNLSGGSAQRS